MKNETNWRYNWYKLGIEGRGGVVALCVFTKTNEILRNISTNGGNGAKWAKYFFASCSSPGMYWKFRTNQS